MAEGEIFFTFGLMERLARVAAVLATATVLYFTIPVVVDMVRGTSLPSPPDWFRSFWDWSRPFRFGIIAIIIALGIAGALLDGKKSEGDVK
jgi:type II secretory pathway component PulF